MIDNLLTEMDSLYDTAKISLLNPDNYNGKVDLVLVQLQLMVVENSLSLTINRIAYLRWFICNDESIIRKMYPFTFLKDDVKIKIKEIFIRISHLYDCGTKLFPNNSKFWDVEPFELE